MLLFSASLISQSGFERIYRFSDNTEHLTVDGKQAMDGGYVFLSLVTERDSSSYRSANITKVSTKGDIEFSQDLVLEDSLELLLEGDLEFIAGNRMAITLTGVQDSLSHYVIVTNASAVPDWSRKYSVYQDTMDVDYYRPRIKASQELDLSLYKASAGIDHNVRQVYLSRIGIINGASAWSKYLSKPGPDGTTMNLDFGDITTTLEGGIAVAGVDDETKEFFMSKVSEDGEIEWSRSIATTLISSNSVVNSITQLQDSSYVIVGSYFTQNVEFDGFVIKTDKTGLITWSKRVDFDFSFNDVHLLDVIASQDSGLLISAKQIGELDTAAFGLKLDLDGNVLWQSLFKTVDVDNVNLGGLSTANGSGMSMFCNGGNLIGDDQYTPYLIVTDSMGMTQCNDTIDMQIVFDANFTTDTLELTISDYINTYDTDCCDNSFIIGDVRNNSPTRIKNYGQFTYLSATNINATGERIATFSKIDEDNQVVWTQEFADAATIFDFEKINDAEFLLVGYTEPLSTSVDNSSFLVKIDDDGNITGGGSMNLEGREILTSVSLHPNPINPLFPIYVSGVKNYNSAPSATDQNMVMNIDEDFNINWINNYNFENGDTQASRLRTLQNGNVMIFGDIKPQSNGILSEINGLNGDVIATRASNDSNFFIDIEELPNGNFVGVGGVQVGAVWSATIYLMNAEYEFLAGISYDNGEINFFREVELSDDGTVYVTGQRADGSAMLNAYSITENSITPLSTRILELNDTNATYPYFDINGTTLAYASGGTLINSDSDIALYTGDLSTTFFCFKERDLMAQSFTTVMDTVVMSFAVDSIPDFVNVNSMEIDFVNTDICSQNFFSNSMLLGVDANPFGGHEVPVVALEVRGFCANEPLEWTFDAETPGATDYLWTNSDGEELGTADTLFVEEEGVYFVEVTIGTDVCFTLCDSAELAVFEEPMVSIGVDTTSICNDEFTLTASPSPANETAIVSYMWSNNQTGPTIDVDTEGIFTVTAIDDCGIEAVASFDVVFDQPAINASIVVDEGPFCTDGTFLLTAVGDPDNETSLVSYLWSTGEITESISVSTEQDYTVTVTDECGTMTTTATFSPVFPILVTGATTDINSAEFCDSLTYTLFAFYEPANADAGTVFIEWSTGDDDFEIDINTPGNYSFTITDFCQNEFVEQFNITFPSPPIIGVTQDTLCTDEGVRLSLNSDQINLEDYNITWSDLDQTGPTVVVPFDADKQYTATINNEECGDREFTFQSKACTAEFDFPNVFIANYDDMNDTGYNDGFGLVVPNPDDNEFPDEIDTYELVIYNRLGEKVFETTDYLEHWDGIYQDKPAPGGVYMFYAKVGFNNGVEETAKGDFTMIR